MTDYDILGMQRLMAYAFDAISAQEPHVADQLEAAMADGKVSLRFQDSVAAPVAVVVVDGYELVEVDIQNLLE